MALPERTPRRRCRQRLIRWAMCLMALGVLAGCGGIPPSVPGSGVLNRQPATTIGADEAVRISFPRPLDSDSLSGRIRVTQDELPVDFGVSLEDSGYSLVVFPRTEWRHGKPVTIRLGRSGAELRFRDGETISEIELTYMVEEIAK